MRESGEPCNTGRSRSSSPASIDASRTTIVQIYIIVDRNKSALVYVNGGGRRRGRGGVSFALSMSIDNVLAVCRISFHVFSSGSPEKFRGTLHAGYRSSVCSLGRPCRRLRSASIDWVPEKSFPFFAAPANRFHILVQLQISLDFFLFHSREIVEYRGGVSLVSKKTGGRDGITQRVAQRTTERHKFSCAVVIVSLLQSNFRHRTGNETGTRAGRFYGRSEV